MNRATLLRRLRSLSACQEAVTWVKTAAHDTLADAWNDCDRPDWMLWYLHKSGADERLMVLLSCDCAATSLKYFSAVYPKDKRPANAIRVARRWAKGKATDQEAAAARVAAWDAALDAARGAAWDAAWDAARVAAGAAARVAAWDAAWDAARAAARAAAGDAAWAAANRRMTNLIRKRVPNPEAV